ncbi:MAG: IS1595 family transposase [Candidatus Vogelbacteria bacterium]|nr:IS1595 family transposase [Candidatus Vogelbacteria bacterium]
MYKKSRPKGSRLSEDKFRRIAKCFALDLTAEDTARLHHVHRHTARRYYTHFRSLIFEHTTTRESVSGEVEVDESYFGPTRVRGKRGRGAGLKTIVFGILKRNGKVYTSIVENCKIPTIVPIIEKTVSDGATVYSDDLGTYRFLYLRYDHKITYHGRNQFAVKGNHINGIESFWAYTKHRIRKFKGIRKDKFLVYLKESEWRFNHRHDDLYKKLMFLLP